MSPDEMITAVCKRWVALWPTLEPAVDYQLPNTVKPLPATYFARLRVIHLETTQRTIGREGGRKYETEALIDVRLSGPVGDGAKRLYQLAKHVRQVFQGRRFGRRANDFGIVTHAMSLAELYRDPEAQHLFVLTATTPFEYYERG
jgi:hypothetical protein